VLHVKVHKERQQQQKLCQSLGSESTVMAEFMSAVDAQGSQRGANPNDQSHQFPGAEVIRSRERAEEKGE
jgi:hypothetical protein